jgi:hypothetical protein
VIALARDMPQCDRLRAMQRTLHATQALRVLRLLVWLPGTRRVADVVVDSEATIVTVTMLLVRACPTTHVFGRNDVEPSCIARCFGCQPSQHKSCISCALHRPD